MLNFKYHLTEEEYFDYNYFTSWAAPEKKNYRLWYYLRVFILYSAVAGLYIFSRRSEQIFIDLIIFGVIALVYFLMVPYLIKRSILRRVRNILAKPENHHVLEEAEVMLSDAGIVDKDAATESRYTWEAIVKKAETPSCYYLYTSTYHAIVIPRRVIATTQDKLELERLFNAYLPLSSEFPT